MFKAYCRTNDKNTLFLAILREKALRHISLDLITLLVPRPPRMRRYHIEKLMSRQPVEPLDIGVIATGASPNVSLHHGG